MEKQEKDKSDEIRQLKERIKELEISETGRKQAEQALQEAKDTIDAMGDGLILQTLDGKITFVNPAFEKMTGYKKGELVGQDAADVATKVIKPEELEKAMGAIQTTLDEKAPVPILLTLVSKDGREVPVTFTVSFIKDVEGKPSTVIVVFKDITELKREEDKLRESNETLQLMIKNSRDVIFRIELDKGYTFMNPSVEGLLGYCPEDYYNDPEFWRKITHPDDISKAENMFASISEGKDPPTPWELRQSKKNGDLVYLEFTLIAIRDETGNIVALEGVARDITGHKRIEGKLRESEELHGSLSAIYRTPYS